MPILPSRLISNEDKNTVIASNNCENCCVYRRTNLNALLTPGGEIDPDIWNPKEIFGLSVNIYLCNTEELEIESYKDDVNYVLVERDNTLFTSDTQLEKYEFDKIESEKKDTIIAYMVIKELNKIKGTFPFVQGKNETEYNYKLSIEYHPNVLNAFHFQVEVTTDKDLEGTGEWGRVERSKYKKGYVRAIATDIRAQMLRDKSIYQLAS